MMEAVIKDADGTTLDTIPLPERILRTDYKTRGTFGVRRSYFGQVRATDKAGEVLQMQVKLVIVGKAEG
jgi:beta-phosphoglucomutase-like phosphatase (HAD superfamily)